MISVVVKALNEEQCIAKCIESALAAVTQPGLEGEVILADSLSTDATVEIACRYPVTVVQLVDAAHRCCGVGPQLGYQVARGDYIYVIDGDMELDKDFLTRGMEALQSAPRLAGVAGQVEHVGGVGYEFRVRKKRHDTLFAPGAREWLDGGGLYRRSALQDVGYLSNRNLHACEEQELGLRLRSAGWSLERLPIPAVTHHAHNDDSVGLWRRRWRSRYVDGAGELTRAAFGAPHFWGVLKHHKNQAITVALVLSLLVGVLSLPLGGTVLWLSLAANGALVGYFLLAKGLRDGVSGVLNMYFLAVGFLRGLLRRQVDPHCPVPYRVIKAAPTDKG